MHPVLTIALRAARSAAETLIQACDRPDRISVIERKGKHLVTSMDVEAEKTIVYHLQKAYPQYGIDSRLSGHTPGEDTDHTWLIDPLCGNLNFLRGYPLFSICIALKTPRGVMHAVVVNPLQNEEFTATRGAGAQLNAHRLRVSRHTVLEDAMLVLDAEVAAPDDTLLVNLQTRLLAAGADIRLSGCPALDITAVAAGKADAGWSRQTHASTLAAPLLILQEAGALISDPQGNPQTGGSKELIFGNPKCFKHLLQVRQSISATAPQA